MALSLIENTLCSRFLKLSLNTFTQQTRNLNIIQKTKLRYPSWFTRRHRVVHEDYITSENREFIKEIVKDRNEILAAAKKLDVASESPLSSEPQETRQWTPRSRRTGLIVRKIGEYPLWDKKGRKVLATLLQVADNQVIKYMPPNEFEAKVKRATLIKNPKACLLVGAETIDPSLVTKEYYGIFNKTGVPVKRNLCRFFITPDAQLSPGTPLIASHFRVGDVVDVRGKTIDRGFQGVMKRWGFKGMPATHGVTKTHRRPGNIGGGGEKGRVWPGKKMPGHMGNKWRIFRGAKILRINNKYNVLWVLGVGIPGPTNGICYVYDTILPLRKHQTAPPFPTYYENGDEEEDVFLDEFHPFSAPTIAFNE